MSTRKGGKGHYGGLLNQKHSAPELFSMALDKAREALKEADALKERLAHFDQPLAEGSLKVASLNEELVTILEAYDLASILEVACPQCMATIGARCEEHPNGIHPARIQHARGVQYLIDHVLEEEKPLEPVGTFQIVARPEKGDAFRVSAGRGCLALSMGWLVAALGLVVVLFVRACQ
jgi:hypothetical protein